jgi:hypothetical protein
VEEIDDEAPDVLATLLACPPEMLDVSLDQLRTLAVVHTTGTGRNAPLARWGGNSPACRSSSTTSTRPRPA